MAYDESVSKKNITVPVVATPPVDTLPNSIVFSEGRLLRGEIVDPNLETIGWTDIRGFYPFRSHTFTTCGKSGTAGPSLTQVRSAYSSLAWAQDAEFMDVTATGKQLWTVPVDGTYRLDIRGAAGGASNDRNNSNVLGGKGARMRGDFVLERGHILEICIGQLGTATYNSSRSAGGGGASYVYNKTTGQLLLIAGGGGGAGDRSLFSTAHATVGVTSNRGSFYGGGHAGTNSSNGGGGGTGGSSGGGAGWNANGGTSSGGKGGVRLSLEAYGGSGYSNGGAGGFGGGGGGYLGGGGGGGYSGGGGGGWSYGGNGGGGGGWSYGGQNLYSQAQANSGHGYLHAALLD